MVSLLKYGRDQCQRDIGLHLKVKTDNGRNLGPSLADSGGKNFQRMMVAEIESNNGGYCAKCCS